jgi:hypothetical protein
MSNANLIARMLDALGQFEQGQLTPEQLEECFLICMEGLERIRSTELSTSRHLVSKLLDAYFLQDEIEFGSPEDARRAADECRQFLNPLPK